MQFKEAESDKLAELVSAGWLTKATLMNSVGVEISTQWGSESGGYIQEKRLGEDLDWNCPVERKEASGIRKRRARGWKQK